MAKPLHIGHLRPAIIGESLKRLARSLGHRVIGDVHLGDWGMPMGLVIGELKLRHPQWRCFASDFSPETDAVPSLDAASLNEIYPLASKKAKEDPDFKALAHQITADLQNGEPGYTSLWKEILRVSVEDMKKSYAQLNVEFDLWYGESNADQYVGQLVDTLTQKGLLYKSEGAMVVDVALPEDKAPMPPVIIKKSDDSSIYATTDHSYHYSAVSRTSPPTASGTWLTNGRGFTLPRCSAAPKRQAWYPRKPSCFSWVTAP